MHCAGKPHRSCCASARKQCGIRSLSGPSIGTYILDSLGRAWHWLRRQASAIILLFILVPSANAEALYICPVGGFWFRYNSTLAASLPSSNAASCAFWFASAARSAASAACLLAMPTFSSDRRINSLWRNPAIRLNMISSATPMATRLFASVEPHCSIHESYNGWYAAMATSPATPPITKAPPIHAHRSQAPIDRSRSPSLALIIPFGRRHAGKGFVGFWSGIAFVFLILVLFFGLWFVLGMPQ